MAASRTLSMEAQWARARSAHIHNGTLPHCLRHGWRVSQSGSKTVEGDNAERML
jgi:hypothetical protein